MRSAFWMAACLAVVGPMLIGCGTTKSTDTKRTATEQLLISDAMDRAVSQLDFRALAGKEVYLDTTPMRLTTDSAYLTSLIRQHMLASGCILRDTKTGAEYIAEARAGAVGTNRHELLFGVPRVNIPSVVPMAAGIPTSIPEIPVVKKTDQRGVVKIGMFAYNQKTGRPIWQSGSWPSESDAKDTWILGAGPFQQGSIHEGTAFAGGRLKIPLVNVNVPLGNEIDRVSVIDEAYFVEPMIESLSEEMLAKAPKKTTPPPVEKTPVDSKVIVASATDTPKSTPTKKSPVVHASLEVDATPKPAPKADPKPKPKPKPTPDPKPKPKPPAAKKPEDGSAKEPLPPPSTAKPDAAEWKSSPEKSQPVPDEPELLPQALRAEPPSDDFWRYFKT